ncbi:MAG: PaaI family thioesterase [Gemmatimonadota bacterium]
MLGIRFIAVELDRVVAELTITPALHQPFGLLHGGASVAVAETVASIGAWINIDQDDRVAVGLEINANHIRPRRDGTLTATGRPLHRGRTTQVWEVEITDERGRLVCISRCTVAVVQRDGGGATVGL